MISGSLASIFYGEPRLTMDVDIVIHLEANQADALSKLYPADNFYLPPSEVLANELARPTHGHSMWSILIPDRKRISIPRVGILIGNGLSNGVAWVE